MSSEIQRLQEALDNAQSERENSVLRATVDLSDTTLVYNDPSPSQSITLPQISTTATQCRTIGNVTLSIAQVNDLFKIYFARCHRYLPFTMVTQSPDAMYSDCPLLFWVICAVAAHDKLKSQLAPLLKVLLADTIHSQPRTIATVQALLIMSTWPFSVTAVADDPSDFYCGIATQMALRLGVHRPTQSHLHTYGSEEHASASVVSREVQLTTWMACFIVSQRNFLFRGVPQPAWVDDHLLNAFDDFLGDPVLRLLCRIFHTLMQAYLYVGAKAPTDSGMLAPASRLTAVASWVDQLAKLEAKFVDVTNDAVKHAFLTTRMGILAFCLLDDMPVSEQLLEQVQSAKRHACDLIELGYGQNLATAPAHVRNALSYAGFILIKILRARLISDAEVLQDQIERVRQILSTSAPSVDDTYRKASHIMHMLTYVEDKRLSLPIYTRMGASVVFDLLRICAEHRSGAFVEAGGTEIDLEGFDWNVWECLT
ncbi:hypothetical protein LTR84_001781 [Exophiala bonariae]|uniref:Transcription factor domain-containing protein n=1 Tax=Exophiala bonariae TaxID=1690606 RepID=A0AAV9NBL6_9EURO|nr:hypothetical protein LTR84_001781 [Exophiala bonariae]